MTKIKNTKKGMAKKTLSISLVAAMLATSNVPVWATEFGDGSDTSVFTSEAPAIEIEEVPAAKVIGDTWEVTLNDQTPMPKEIEWGTADKTITVKIKAADDEYSTTKLKYVWKGSDDLALDEEKEIETGKDVNVTLPTPEKDAVGQSYTLFIYDESGDWTYTSSPVTVTAKDITNTCGLTATNVEYNGKEINKSNVTLDKTTDGLVLSDFNIDFTDSTNGNDLVNAGTIYVTAQPKDSVHYKGIISTTFEISKHTLAADDALVKATLVKKEIPYTGNDIATLDKSYVNVTDANTSEDLNSIVSEVTVAASSTTFKNAGDEAVVTAKLKATDTTKNFTGESGTAVAADKVKVVARDLSTVKATVETIVKKQDGKAITDNDLTVTFEDADGNALNLAGDVDIVVPSNVVNYGQYNLTVKPKDANKNVTGSITVPFTVVSLSLKDATFEKTDYAGQAEEYTGSQVTKDLTKLGSVMLNNKAMDPADYEIKFDANVDAGDDAGIIEIIGKRTYEGSKAVVKFDINAAKVTDAELSASDYVLHNKKAASAADYASEFKLVVKAKNAATPAKEFTLTEGTDYTVAYTYEGGNTIGKSVIATVTLKNKNFENGNTQSAALTKKVRIANPVIKDTDIRLKNASYEYTGAVITPDFDVIVNGETLKKDTDYVIQDIENSAKVGTATMTITGKGEYDDIATAKVNFEVTPASTEKVEVKVNAGTEYTYDGKAKKPEVDNITVTLNGNVVTDQFDIVSYGENINAGKEGGSFVIAPKKDNKNFTSGTSKTAAFEIKQAELTGTIKVYDEKGILLKKDNEKFEYDGEAKTFAKVIFTPGVTTPVTENDYEIRYINNITGSEGAKILVVAKGNYTANDTADDATSGTKVTVENVVETWGFTIESKLYFTEKEVIIKDAEYAGTNILAKPEITVYDGNKVLKEGTDYEITLATDHKFTNEVAGVEEPGNTEYYWKVVGKGVYADIETAGRNQASGTWKVVKKNVANLDISSVNMDSEGKITATVMNGNLRVDNKNFTFTLSEDKKTVTVASSEGNKYYVGSQDVALGDAAIETPVISAVNATGNNATVVLSGECDGATGYDYVISTDRDCITNKDYDKVNKNILNTTTTFTYTQKGVYYAYCHAWKRVDGKKVFSDWSNAYIFTVEATTPDQPAVTSVKVSGSTVTVTYTEAANAEGYDVVLGTAVKKVAGENRPVEYGKLVKKNIKNGVVTATFKNVPKGTYYAGLHAWNRTSENGKKVFSPWSNTKKVTVK